MSTNSQTNAATLRSEEKTASHTAGKWLAERDDSAEAYDIGVRDAHERLRLVATVRFGFSEPAESEQHANARLIAAAPELLAGAKAILAARSANASLDAIIQLRDAVAKAEGRL